jgi:short-subunit dehydrogenase
MRVRDAVAVVTGASSGIGRETAILLARKGARVWAVARSESSLKELAGEQSDISPLVADLTSDTERAGVARSIERADILVNNAGIGWHGLVENMELDQVRRLFDVNVVALIDLSRRFLPAMLERRRGHVVSVASVASWVSVPPLTVYSATKFAVQGFADGLRREVAGRGVAVTTVNPGPIATKFFQRAQRGDCHSEQLDDDLKIGLPPGVVARAIVRAIRMGGMPGYQTIAVPRPLGVVRLGAVPGLRLLVDAGSMASRPAYRRIDERRD